MRRWRSMLLLFLMVLHSKAILAQPGFLFQVSSSGNPMPADVLLCLNGKGSLSCQNYHVSAQDLQISTTLKRHYPAVGIKILTAGYQTNGCTPYSNGYCLFAASHESPSVIHLTSSVPMQNQTISFTSTAPSATVGGLTYTPTAAASSGLPVTISVDSSSSSICSISSGVVSFSAAGTCLLNGNQAGNTSYNPAPQVRQSISVIALSASLSISSSTLVLAQAGLFTAASGAAAGASKSRTLSITNNGQGTATNLSIAFDPVLSAGTSVDTTASTACTSTTVLAQNDSCTVSITPGTPSNIGSAPASNTMTVTASNASNSVSAAIITLTYGSLYGDGYVFSIDDSTASTSSVGLVKVAATSDLSAFPWDADPACASSPYQCTHAPSASSTTNGTNLSTPEAGNTYLIWNQLSNLESADSYAAGACVTYVSSGNYNDWYLPAICEMGYEASVFGAGSGCGGQATPLIQNMQSNLIDIDNGSSLALGLVNGGNLGTFWSSSTYPPYPRSNARYQTFSSSGSASIQRYYYKFGEYGVRCVRGFIP